MFVVMSARLGDQATGKEKGIRSAHSRVAAPHAAPDEPRVLGIRSKCLHVRGPRQRLTVRPASKYSTGACIAMGRTANSLLRGDLR